MKKIDKSLARLIKKKRKRAQINKIRNQIGEALQKYTKDHKRLLWAKKMENLDEMDKFLERYWCDLPRLNQEEIENMKKPITSAEIETVTEKKKKKQCFLALTKKEVLDLECSDLLLTRSEVSKLGCPYPKQYERWFIEVWIENT